MQDLPSGAVQRFAEVTGTPVLDGQDRGGCTRLELVQPVLLGHLV
ncbi:hypothetical protein [Cryobacterium adonitolivorans]|nr:hypothetical protein [Cryobacterium adonitolivorans]